MAESHEGDITQLEVLVMEHERLLEHYSDLMLSQQSQVDQLNKRLRQLEMKMEAAQEVDNVEGLHQPPPHY